MKGSWGVRWWQQTAGSGSRSLRKRCSSPQLCYCEPWSWWCPDTPTVCYWDVIFYFVLVIRPALAALHTVLCCLTKTQGKAGCSPFYCSYRHKNAIFFRLLYSNDLILWVLARHWQANVIFSQKPPPVKITTYLSSKVSWCFCIYLFFYLFLYLFAPCCLNSMCRWEVPD